MLGRNLFAEPVFLCPWQAWYLNNISQRNNARVIHAIAKEFNFPIPLMQDTSSYEDAAEIASCCTETMLHSMHRDQATNQVVVTNCCMDPRQQGNGVLCSMHPTEGVWLFKGPPVTKHQMMNYGGTFGHDAAQGHAAFPTSTPPSSNNYSFKYKAPAGSPMQHHQISLCMLSDSPVVARLDANGVRLPPQQGSKHVCIDEAYMRKLNTLQWNRDNGMVELIPIAVVVTDANLM